MSKPSWKRAAAGVAHTSPVPPFHRPLRRAVMPPREQSPSRCQHEDTAGGAAARAGRGRPGHACAGRARAQRRGPPPVHVVPQKDHQHHRGPQRERRQRHLQVRAAPQPAHEGAGRDGGRRQPAAPGGAVRPLRPRDHAAASGRRPRQQPDALQRGAGDARAARPVPLARRPAAPRHHPDALQRLAAVQRVGAHRRQLRLQVPVRAGAARLEPARRGARALPSGAQLYALRVAPRLHQGRRAAERHRRHQAAPAREAQQLRDGRAPARQQPLPHHVRGQAGAAQQLGRRLPRQARRVQHQDVPRLPGRDHPAQRALRRGLRQPGHLVLAVHHHDALHRRLPGRLRGAAGRAGRRHLHPGGRVRVRVHAGLRRRPPGRLHQGHILHEVDPERDGDPAGPGRGLKRHEEKTGTRRFCPRSRSRARLHGHI